MLLNSGSLNISGSVLFTRNGAKIYGGAIALHSGDNSISGIVSFCYN